MSIRPSPLRAWFLQTLPVVGGIVATAKRVGVTPSVHYHWLRTDPAYAAAVAQIYRTWRERGEAWAAAKRAKAERGRRRDERAAEKRRRFLEAYARLGSIVQAAEAVGVAHSAHAKWMRRHPDYREAFQPTRNGFATQRRRYRRPRTEV